MFRGIPRKYTAHDLAKEIQDLAPVDAWDFISLPWDADRPSNLGFAFINFTRPEHAEQVRKGLCGRTWRLSPGGKLVTVLTANIQGLANNVRHISGNISPRVGEEHHPLVRIHGARLEFREVVKLFDMQAHSARTAPACPQPLADYRHGVASGAPEGTAAAMLSASCIFGASGGGHARCCMAASGKGPSSTPGCSSIRRAMSWQDGKGDGTEGRGVWQQRIHEQGLAPMAVAYQRASMETTSLLLRLMGHVEPAQAPGCRLPERTLPRHSSGPLPLGGHAFQ